MLAPIRAPRAVDVTTDQLRRAILTGEVGAGERLPAERQLAETLGIHRQTLRAALGRLEAEGLLLARQGSGVVVQDWRITGGIGLLPHLVSAGRTDLLAPFLAVRRAVAAEAVAAACVRATDAELDALAGEAERLAAEPDLDALAAGNLEFGRCILRLARNTPAELLFNTVAAVYAGEPSVRRVMLGEPDAVRQSFPAIVALLRSRDPERASAAVRRVLEALDAASVARLEAP